MIRRLLRWFMLDDLEAAMSVGAELKAASMEQEVEARCELAKAEGILQGRQEAFEAVQRFVDIRHGRRIEDEDITNAQRGLLH